MSLIALALLVLWIALIAAVVGGAIRVLGGDRALDATVEIDEARMRLRELTQRKAVLVELLRSTDDDLEAGKVDADDHRRTRRALEREAVGVMRQIEEMRGSPEDLAEADRALDRVARDVRDERTARSGGWSEAAMARHGGRPPSADRAPAEEPA